MTPFRQPGVLRVCQFFGQSSLGGVPTHMLGLSTALEQRGHTVCIATQDDSEVATRAKELGLTVRNVGRLTRDPSWSDDRATRAELKELIREWRPDVLHLHGFKAGLIGRTQVRLQTAVIYTPHCPAYLSQIGTWKRVIAYAIESSLAIRSSAIISVGEWEYRALHLPRAVLIPNAVEVSPGARRRQPRRPAHIVFPARLSEPKRQDLLLAALARFRPDERPRVTFAGAGPKYGELIAMAQSLGVTESVNFPGHLSGLFEGDVPYDLAVLLSDWEGQPLSVLEALSAGVPVLGSDVGGFRAIARGNRAVSLVDNTAEAVEAGLRALVRRNQSQYQQLSQEAMAVREKFAYEKMVDSIESLYRRVGTAAGSQPLFPGAADEARNQPGPTSGTFSG